VLHGRILADAAEKGLKLRHALSLNRAELVWLLRVNIVSNNG
jgi:hypothetical protein